MKELEPRLTISVKTAYSRAGDIFMEGNSEGLPKISQQQEQGNKNPLLESTVDRLLGGTRGSESPIERTRGSESPRLLNLSEIIERDKRLGAVGIGINNQLKKGLLKNSQELRELWMHISSISDVDDVAKGKLLDQITDLMELKHRHEEEERRIYEKKAEEREKRGLYGETKLTDDQKKIIIRGSDEDTDILFNSIFVKADSNPKEPFEKAFSTTGQLELTDFMTTLHRATSDLRNHDGDYIDISEEERQRLLKQIERRIIQYSDEAKTREVIHTANYAVLAGIGTEKLSEFMQSFSAELIDLAFSKKAVVETMHFYEQAMQKVMQENNGHLPYVEMVGDPDSETEEGKMGRVQYLTKQYLDEALRLGLIKGTEKKDEAGNITYELASWEKDRAIAFARGLSIMIGRSIEIAATSKMPRSNPLISLYAQDVIKDIAPFRHAIGKFNLAEEGNRFMAFLLNRGRGPWSKDELERFNKIITSADGAFKLVDVVNGMLDEDQETYLSVLNPFKIGGIFTKTTWRVSNEDAMTGAIGHLAAEDRKKEEEAKNRGQEYKEQKEMDWIGTGVWIEKVRGDLVNPKEAVKAEVIATKNLEKMARIQPLKLFNNFRVLREQVLDRIIEENIYQPDKTIPEIKYKDGQKDYASFDQHYAVIMETRQLREDLDKLVILQEKAMHDRSEDLDFNLIENADQRRRLSRFTEVLRDQFHNNGHLTKFIKDLKEGKDWKVPFNLGVEDVPFDKYRFGTGGGTSIARRWRDINSERAAAVALGKFLEKIPTFKTDESIVEALYEVSSGIKGYDAGIAKDVVLKLAEGITKFYEKDWKARLPFGIGTVVSATTAESFAQAAFGRGQMAWNEFQINEFTRKLRDTHLLTEKQQHKLQERVGGGKKELTYAMIRTIVPLLAFALLFYLLSKSVKEK